LKYEVSIVDLITLNNNKIDLDNDIEITDI